MQSSPLDSIHDRTMGCGILSSPLDCTNGRTMLDVAILSLPMGNTYDRMTSSIKCHHYPFDSIHGRTTSTLHAIITFGLHTRTDSVGNGMLSSPLYRTHGQRTSAMEIPSSPLESIHHRTASGVEYNHRHWTAHTIGYCRVWHARMNLR